MIGNGKVFISHSHEDTTRCVALLASLDAWGVDYWFDDQRLDAGHELSQRIQQALDERDIFIRICSPAAQKSYWVRLETGAFRGLQAKGQESRRDRRLISIVIDEGYTPEPFDYAYVFINARDKPQREWISELRRALGLGQDTSDGSANQPSEKARTPRPTEGQRQTPSQLHGIAASSSKQSQSNAQEISHGAPALTNAGIPYLVVHEGVDKGKTFTLHASVMSIGTSQYHPIQLTDPTVAFTHARIIKRESGPQTGQRHIKDASSKTGTFVNGRLIDSQRTLQDGDEIRVGATVLVYRDS